MSDEKEQFWLGDEMPIGGYYGPIASYEDKEFGYITEDFLQDKYFKLIADCGLNIIVSADSDYNENPQEIMKTLELCEKYQMRFFVRDKGLLENMPEQERERRISAYSSSKAFAGIRVVDEPSACGFPKRLNGEQLLVDNPLQKFQDLAAYINDHENWIGYINLLPFYYWMGNTVEEYYDYLKVCCEASQAKVISYDHYPFDFAERERALQIYFMNLGIIRDTAKQKGLPFWAFVQSGGQWNDRKRRFESRPYYPLEGEFLWNVNTCLAMGARGIQYFPLTQPYWFGFTPNGIDPRRNGMIGADGKPNCWFDYAKKANRQIKAVDEFLMNATHEGVIASGKVLTYMDDVKCKLPQMQFRELQKAETTESGFVIGCFDYNGQTMFYVVNGDMYHSQKMKMQFDSTYKLKLVSGEETADMVTKQLEFRLESGEAMLILVER